MSTEASADYEQCKYIYTGSRRVRPGFSWKIGRFLGMLQCIFGVLSISCQMLLLNRNAPYSKIGVAGWGGALFMVAGTCGIIASHFRTDCSIHSFNVSSVIAALCAILLLVFSCLDFTLDPVIDSKKNSQKRTIYLICLIGTSAAEIIVAIVSSVICAFGTFFGPASVAVTYEIPAQIRYATPDKEEPTAGTFQQVSEGACADPASDNPPAT